MELRAADDTISPLSTWTARAATRPSGHQSKDDSGLALYYLNSAISKSNKGTNRVTVIAIGNSLIVYINGVLVANLNVKQTAGGVRIAAYNYQQASSICQFTNLWLRSFDR